MGSDGATEALTDAVSELSLHRHPEAAPTSAPQPSLASQDHYRRSIEHDERQESRVEQDEDGQRSAADTSAQRPDGPWSEKEGRGQRRGHLSFGRPRPRGSSQRGSRSTLTDAKRNASHEDMKRPDPSWDYLRKAGEMPERLASPRALLVILDTNGTLLRRQGTRRRDRFEKRPGVDNFIQYLVDNHKPMVWSSARAGTINFICHQLFTPEQFDQLVAIWSRENLGMSSTQYLGHGLVYKELWRVWRDSDIQKKRSVATQAWSQANTVLIDDTPDKAAGEPHNVIRITTFVEGGDSGRNEDAFTPVIQYLEELRSQRNVSAYMQHNPFEHTQAAKP